jgi:hypothetical protein
MNFGSLLQEIETLSVPSIEFVGFNYTGLMYVYVIIFMKTAWTSIFLLHYVV